jgi:hypothetical protein
MPSTALTATRSTTAWVPRTWNARFGTMTFMHNLQPWILDEAPWEVGYVEGSTPAKKIQPHPNQPP